MCIYMPVCIQSWAVSLATGAAGEVVWVLGTFACFEACVIFFRLCDLGQVTQPF